jgi:plastocyanin
LGTRQSRLVISIVGVILAGTGCDSTEQVSSGPSCGTSSTSIKLIAANNRFDATCLTAPADQPLEIVFDNQAADFPHNVAIYAGKEALFQGEIVTGPRQIRYPIEPLEAGRYVFRCDVHPGLMRGELRVQ